jgi:hypothetical protein
MAVYAAMANGVLMDAIDMIEEERLVPHINKSRDTSFDRRIITLRNIVIKSTRELGPRCGVLMDAIDMIEEERLVYERRPSQ